MPRAKTYTRPELLATLEAQATRYALQSGTAHGLAQLAERALADGDTEEARFLVREISLATHPRRGEDGACAILGEPTGCATPPVPFTD